MKKAILVAIFGLTALSYTYAQPMWGMSGGLNWSSLSASDYKLPPNDPDFGSSKNLFQGESIQRVRFGIRTERPIKPWLFFQPEAYYSMKGGIFKGDSTYSEIFVPPGFVQTTQFVDNIDLNYLEIPLLMKAQIKLTQPNKLYPYENTGSPLFLDVFAGPYIAYALSANSFYSSTIRLKSADTTVLPDINQKVTQERSMTNVGKFDFGIVAGLSLKLMVSRKTCIFIDGRWQTGLANINKGYFDFWANLPTPEKAVNYVKQSPVIKNASLTSVQFGITTNLTGRRYFWLNR